MSSSQKIAILSLDWSNISKFMCSEGMTLALDIFAKFRSSQCSIRVTSMLGNPDCHHVLSRGEQGCPFSPAKDRGVHKNVPDTAAWAMLNPAWSAKGEKYKLELTAVDSGDEWKYSVLTCSLCKCFEMLYVRWEGIIPSSDFLRQL